MLCIRLNILPPIAHRYPSSWLGRCTLCSDHHQRRPSPFTMTGPNPSHDPASALKEPVISYGAIVRDDPPADTHDEQASLLGRPRPGSRRPSLSVSMLSLSQDRRRQLLFIVLLVFIAICIDIGASMLVAPMQRIYESIICRDYYREHDPTMIGKDREVEEGLCKVPHVQLELAKLRAWLGLMESLPGE